MALTLTIAVAVAIVVPALVGYWRDPRRGVMALAGTLLGATLAQFWASRWGQDLAGGSSADARMTTFVLSSALLVTSALLIGYGSGVLLPPATGRAPLPRRLLGMLLGLLNGGLLAGYTLRYAAAASPGFAEELLTIPIAEWAHDGLPLFFLGLAVVLAAMILVRRAVQLMRRPRQPTTPASAPTAPLTPPSTAPGSLSSGAPPAKDVQRKGTNGAPPT